MANSILTPDIIAKEALMQLENTLVMGNLVHKDYSSEFQKVGDTITIERPQQYQGQSDNLDVTSYNEDLIAGGVPLKIDKTETVKFSVSPQERTLDISEFSEKRVKPAVAKLRDRVETELAGLYNQVYQFSGTPGTTPSTFRSLADCGTILTNAACPNDTRYAIHDPNTSVSLADSLKSVYVSEKAKTAFEKATIGYYGTFDNYESVHSQAHTVGALGGTPLINGSSQGVVTYAASKDTNQSTIATDGWSNSVTGVLKQGDVITIAGVNALNPITGQSTGALQTFVVTADVDSNGSGQADIVVSPALITSGGFATVDAAPADNAAITVKTGAGGASHKQSLLFHPNAFALVTRPLEIASGAGLKTSTKTGNNMTISCSEWVDGNTLKHHMRLDILFGVKCIDPRLACRLTS